VVRFQQVSYLSPWSGIFFKLARCGYTLRVTSQASYSPEYITPTQKNQVKVVKFFLASAKTIKEKAISHHVHNSRVRK
jgi:hypothetical protein